MSDTARPLTWQLIEEARTRVAGRVRSTPVLTSATLDDLSGAQLHFKCEMFQKCGAFKARGAANAVFALTEEEARHGVATHSSGNHAAALARAARLRGIPAYIVMPDNTAQAKRDAVAKSPIARRHCRRVKRPPRSSSLPPAPPSYTPTTTSW
jgi:threonine dehydratase